ncbi:MAG: 23S rRNA (pseudouridine(1915)-N(3))-methyltransferase RlmH [Clostridia bacterium]|nr:23S rRNA (pseudouridine(1915)-N(3))-methyltransferase RlmH [Clostridia bacterium]
MKIRFAVVGKIKESFYREAVAEYLKRLSRFAEVSVVEVAECRTLEEEGILLQRQIRGSAFVLAIEGQKLSSEAFAKKIKSYLDRGREITFVIGSSYGLAPSVKASADESISFSDMTFPHQLMRVILAEQLYRAFMINTGSEYHK